MMSVDIVSIFVENKLGSSVKCVDACRVERIALT